MPFFQVWSYEYVRYSDQGVACRKNSWLTVYDTLNFSDDIIGRVSVSGLILVHICNPPNRAIEK
jgi:hypothetical protein